jgi:hypothetical protein
MTNCLIDRHPAFVSKNLFSSEAALRRKLALQKDVVSSFLVSLKLVLSALAFAVSGQTSSGQTPAVTSQDLTPKIEEYMNALVKAGWFNGSILIARDGKVLVSKGYGMANFELEVPNTLQTKFRLGSITKPFTAMAILLLKSAGSLASRIRSAQSGELSSHQSRQRSGGDRFW